MSFLVLCTLSTKATNYYFASGGNDANTGTSIASPYQTISKLNILSLKAGDNVYFNRGDVFYGQITVSQSGIAGNPITFSAYGTGVNPVITGFTTEIGRAHV